MNKGIEVHDRLVNACDSFVAHWRDDLLVHDKNAIEAAGDDCPFIHAARSTGTDIVMLPPADSPAYPPDGETCAFLFGRATRERVLDAKWSVVNYWMSADDERLVHYWDGMRLRRITVEKATQIVADYERRTRAAWRKPTSSGHHRVTLGCA